MLVEAHNEDVEERQLDIYSLARLIAIGINNPKDFPKSFDKFYKKSEKVDKSESDRVNSEFRRQGAAIGLRVP